MSSRTTSVSNWVIRHLARRRRSCVTTGPPITLLRREREVIEKEKAMVDTCTNQPSGDLAPNVRQRVLHASARFAHQENRRGLRVEVSVVVAPSCFKELCPMWMWFARRKQPSTIPSKHSHLQVVGVSGGLLSCHGFYA